MTLCIRAVIFYELLLCRGFYKFFYVVGKLRQNHVKSDCKMDNSNRLMKWVLQQSRGGENIKVQISHLILEKPINIFQF